MKAGQLIRFIFEALPDDAQAALATLQADAPPMAPSLAEQVIREEFGTPARSPVPRLGPGSRSQRPRSARCTTWSSTTAGIAGGEDPVPGRRGRHRRAISTTPSCSTECSPRSPSKGSTRSRSSTSCGVADGWRSSTTAVEAANLQPLSSRGVRGAILGSAPTSVDPRAVRPAGFLTDGVDRRDVVRPSSWRSAAPAGEAARQLRSSGVSPRAPSMRVGIFNGDPHPGNYRFHANGERDLSSISAW